MALTLKIVASLNDSRGTEVFINGESLRDVRSIRFEHGPEGTPHVVAEVFTGTLDGKGEPEISVLSFGVRGG